MLDEPHFGTHSLTNSLPFSKGLQGRGFRTVENHLVSLWQLWKREENCSLLEWSDTIIITIILVIIFIVMIINMIKSQSRPWSSSPKWWEWSATGRGTAKASEGHKSVQLQNLSFLSGRCHPLLLPNFPKCLIHNCTIFLCSLDVGNIDDQFRCTGTEEKDHPAG